MPVDPRNVEWFDWDDGNVAELAAHDVTGAEAEQVICDDAGAEILRNKRAAAGRWIVIGRTRGGRKLCLIRAVGRRGRAGSAGDHGMG